MEAIGWTIASDAGGIVTLVHHRKKYKIAESDMEDLESQMARYLSFLLGDITKKPRKSGK